MKQEQSDKSTAPTYKRYVDRYERWWQGYLLEQTNTIPGYTMILAFPITPAKASMFLDYECMHEKQMMGEKCTIPNSYVGKESISQTISALEHWRFHHAHQTLWVRTIEKAKKHDEPKWIESSQALKAAGTSSEAELVQCATWCLLKFSGPQHIYIGMRGAAMLLFSTTTAVCGGSIPIDGRKVQVLAAFVDNAKHNQQGHVDEHGALQHHLVELCPVGAMARLFFSFFHIMKQPLPNFAPGFTTDGYSEYGYQEWYGYHVFARKEDVKSEMTYDNHLKQVTIMHKENNVEITKKTHLMPCLGLPHSMLKSQKSSYLPEISWISMGYLAVKSLSTQKTLSGDI
ncbi:hypothetical protein EI94DRAFT_1708110 [Lactarius quietus]|nr:hypothetical protein EI94DRAFT_1708110 [Lactarius quietus]